MTNSGILLSTTAFRSLSVAAQNEVLAAVGIAGFAPPAASSDKLAAGGALQAVDDGAGPVELTVAMARKLTANLGDKPRNALLVIAQSDSPQFHMKDVIERTEGAENYMNMRGIWSALTRRTRKIMDDGDVDLIWWIGEALKDEDGNYFDHVGLVSPMTYHSLRIIFDLN